MQKNVKLCAEGAENIRNNPNVLKFVGAEFIPSFAKSKHFQKGRLQHVTHSLHKFSIFFTKNQHIS